MSGIFLNILLSINMFKYLLDHSHVLHLCKKQVFQLLHCGAVWPVYPTTKTEDTRKKWWIQNMAGWKQVSPLQWKLHSEGNRNDVTKPILIYKFEFEQFKHRSPECWWFIWNFIKIIHELVGYIYPNKAEQFKACCLGFESVNNEAHSQSQALRHLEMKLGRWKKERKKSI